MQIGNLCNQVLDGSMDKHSFYDEIKGYLNDYYKDRYEFRNQSETVNGKVNDMLNKLQEMYAFRN